MPCVDTVEIPNLRMAHTAIRKRPAPIVMAQPPMSFVEVVSSPLSALTQTDPATVRSSGLRYRITQQGPGAGSRRLRSARALIQGAQEIEPHDRTSRRM